MGMIDREARRQEQVSQLRQHHEHLRYEVSKFRHKMTGLAYGTQSRVQAASRTMQKHRIVRRDVPDLFVYSDRPELLYVPRNQLLKGQKCTKFFLRFAFSNFLARCEVQTAVETHESTLHALAFVSVCLS